MIEVVFYGLFFVYLAILSWMDFRTQLLPLEPIILAIFVILIFQFFYGDLSAAIIGMLVALGFFGLQFLLSRGRWIGQGDIWFALSLGAFLGWPHSLVAFYLTYVVGGIIALCLYIMGIYKRKQHLPLVPYLTFGCLSAWIFGDQIMSWFARGFGLG